ncbi:MAG: hypothetical protein CSA23_01320 [Deltaproteobacteria bacterium]|nr:MAG: hypothetical protein CSA23_01320 [Deltaproteobacteria bacterium]
MKNVKEVVNLIMNLDIDLRFGVKLAMFHFEPFLIDFILNNSDPTIYQQAGLFKLFIDLFQYVIV